MNKKEVIRTAKAFKKILKKGIPQTVWKSSYWDIQKEVQLQRFAHLFSHNTCYSFNLFNNSSLFL